MGERIAARESIVCNQPDCFYFRIANRLKIGYEIFQLRNLCGDNLICVHGNAYGYNPCCHTLEEALMSKFKGINGEKKRAS